MHIVLYSPQIPQNTGNIARTCALTGTRLTLVRPLGFSLSKRHLKRAGLDYWDEVEIDVVDSLEEVLVPNRKSLYDFSGADFVESEAIRRSAEDDGNLDKLSRPSTKPGGERCPEKPKDFCGWALEPPFYFLSTKGKTLYTEVQYEKESLLVFGSETDGLPRWVHEKYEARGLKIPMREGLRSLNLSNACAVVLYEALRQQNFPNLNSTP